MLTIFFLLDVILNSQPRFNDYRLKLCLHFDDEGLEAALPTYKTVVKPNTMFFEYGRKSVATSELKIGEIFEFYEHTDGTAWP